MRRWYFCSVLAFFLVSLFSLPQFAYAADITDVADSFDYENKNPFDFRILLSYRLTSTSAVIAREHPKNPEQYFISQPEFKVNRSRHEMLINPKIGLFKDLEIGITIPLVFTDTFSYRPDVSPNSGSSLIDDGIITKPNGKSKHGFGLGDMTVAWQWGIFNDQRDRTKATWVIGMAWTFPSGKLWNPAETVSGQATGVGQGAHVLAWHVAMSKRIGVFDPYMKVTYQLFLVPDETNELLQRNMNLSGIKNDLEARARENALHPSHAGELVMGTEIVFWEHYVRQQKLALDLRLLAHAKFEGRDYNIFTDALAAYRPKIRINRTKDNPEGEERDLRASLITDNEQAFTFGAMFALHFKLSKFGYIRIEGYVKHTSPFFITYAKRGVDLDGNGYVNPGSKEEYPYHVRVLDGIGKRLRQIDTLTWNLQIFAGLTI